MKLFLPLIFAVLFVTSANAKQHQTIDTNVTSLQKILEHRGRTAKKDGCHWDRKKKERHCHSG